jgi:CHASE3 domain sensor protein/nitrogen-specific signal transduction histidine kinase
VKILPSKKVSAVLGLALGLLAVAGLFNWYTTVQLEQAFGSVSRIHQLRANFTRLLAAVQDIQMGQRGYLITGDQRSLQSYVFGVQQAQAQFERLLNLTRDNPQHQARLNALKPLVDGLIAHANSVIALRDSSGFEAAQREVASGKGQTMTDNIRLAIQEFDQEQGALLVKRSSAAREASGLNTKALLASVTIGFALFAVACFLYLRAGGRARVAENESRTKTVMLHSVIQTVNDGVAVADAKQKFLVINPAAEPFLGNGENELQTQWFLPDQTSLGGEQLPLARALRGECVSNLELFVRGPAHAEGAWVNVTAKPLLSEQANVMGAVLVFQQSSRRAAPAAPVRETREPSPKAKKARPEPTRPEPTRQEAVRVEVAPPPAAPRETAPVRPAQTVQVQAAPPLPEAPVPAVSMSAVPPQAVPAETVPLNLYAQSLNTLVEQIVSMLAPAAAIQQINLNQQLASDLPEIALDGDRISQVLMDLLTNALKFTSPGGNILVSTTRQSGEMIHVSVVDNGCGIPTDRCEQIFEESKKKGEASGTVTGLYSAREHVRQHGGDLWVKSEAGQGSTFTFSLPMKNAAAPTVPAEKPAQKSSGHTNMFPDEIAQFSWRKSDKAA